MSPPSLVRVEKWPTVNQLPESNVEIQFWWEPPLDTGGSPIAAYYINILINGEDTGLFFGIPATERVYTYYTSIDSASFYSCIMWCLNENGDFSPYSEETYRVPSSTIPVPISYPYMGLTSDSNVAISACVDANNTYSAPKEYYITQIQNPTTGQLRQLANLENVNISVQPYLQTISSLTEPWYRYMIRVFNYVDWDQPGLSDSYHWQYYKYPYRYNGVSSLQIWLDVAQQPLFLQYPNSLGQQYTVSNFTNFAYTNYLFEGIGLQNVEGLLSDDQFFIYGVGSTLESPQITSPTSLSNEGFTYFLVMRSQMADQFIKNRYNPAQNIGTFSSCVMFCQMDDTPFVPPMGVNDSYQSIYRCTRNPTNGHVTFGFNGSTISTSGQALSTLNDIYVEVLENNQTNGSLYELIYYNSNLPLEALESLEGYLAWKWGIVNKLPPNHPYKNQGP